VKPSIARPRLVAAVSLWIVFSAIEVLFVGKFDAQETPVGIVVALLAAVATVGVATIADLRYHIRWSWLRFVPVVALNVVRDTGVVLGVLLRRCTRGELPHDRIEEIPFDPGADDPESAARRALVVAAVSTSPNTIALEIDQRRRVMRVHHLTPPSRPPRSAEWPL
jgi:multisubunit Na+/H+ antiporter MnhE subunit